MGPGTVIGEKYRVERVIGRGGMGTVVEAKHVQLGTAFALKFLHRSVIGDAAMTERFFREARATAALRSEHVCRVFDVDTFDGVPYLVMERLEGTDLAKALRRAGRLSPHDVCSYLIQACAGVAEAHAAQIVHRDLKPGNLFLTARSDGSPLVKVLDFGIAKAPQDAEHELTGTNTVLGSPAYMSLEQLRSSKQVDARSDIWSLGVILFELIAGRRPFVGEGVGDLAVKIAMEPAPRLPDGPRELDDVIARCLARDPAQRYQSAAELAGALAPYAADAERTLAFGLARPSRPGAPPFAATAPPPRPSPRLIALDGAVTADGLATTGHSAGAIEAPPRPARSSRSSRVRLGLLGTVAAAIIGGASVGVAVSTSGGDGPTPASPAPSAADPAKLAGPLDAAPASTPAPPLAAASPPAPASPPDASSSYEPTFPAGAAVAEPAAASPPDASPDASQPKQPPARPPAAPPRKPPPRTSNDDLGKSRI
jgi:eukaryotic-like serine/threonine-protein kinase